MGLRRKIYIDMAAMLTVVFPRSKDLRDDRHFALGCYYTPPCGGTYYQVFPAGVTGVTSVECGGASSEEAAVRRIREAHGLP